MNELERRYRRWLRAYPASYRAEREDEIVGVLLDAADPGRTRPRWGEVVDLVGAGCRARALGARAAVRSPLGADALAILSVLVTALVAARAVRPVRLTAELALPFVSEAKRLGYLETMARGGWAPLLWALVAVLTVVGLHRLALLGAIGALAAELVFVRWAVVDPYAQLPGIGVAWVVVQVVAVVLLADPARPRRGVALIGRPAAALLVVGLALATAPSYVLPGGYDGSARLAAFALVLAWPAARFVRSQPAATPALLSLVVLSSVLATGSVPLGRADGPTSVARLALLVVVPAAVAVGVLVGRAAWRAAGIHVVITRDRAV